MTRPGSPHAALWRDPADVSGQWLGSPSYDRTTFRARFHGKWREALEATGKLLLVSREYEHLLFACDGSAPSGAVTYLPMPHPSGIAVHPNGREVAVASTRNPNQVYRLRRVSGGLDRLDARRSGPPIPTLVPTRTDFYPGCLYIHDVAFIGNRLYASAAGQNAIVELQGDGRFEPAWWPKTVDRRQGPLTSLNHLQLNSIAAGPSLAASFFTASTDRPGHRRPGHRNFSVDGRGVVFSGRTREPIATGLTRPHSARLHAGRVWLLNSGYGELGYIDGAAFNVVCRLPGWTRGLAFDGDVAFVGTSRILPRFTAYAPGLDPRRSVCGVHAVHVPSGRVLGSALWPAGDQIFAVELVSPDLGHALPFAPGARRPTRSAVEMFYTFAPDSPGVRTRS